MCPLLRGEYMSGVILSLLQTFHLQQRLCQQVSSSSSIPGSVGTTSTSLLKISDLLDLSSGRFPETYTKNVEIRNLFGKMRQGEKTSHIEKFLKQYDGSESSKIAENRFVLKILFRTSHFLNKKIMPYETYSSLVRLISDCGSQALQKFIIKSPKNATYLSRQTFQNIFKVLNHY